MERYFYLLSCHLLSTKSAVQSHPLHNQLLPLLRLLRRLPMSICKNWLCSGISTTTPIAWERTQAQSKQINPDLFNQFYHKNPLLSSILKRKGGEQKITLKIFVKFSFSLLFHFTYFSFHLYLLKSILCKHPQTRGEISRCDISLYL